MNDLILTTLGRVSIQLADKALTPQIPLKAAAILIYGLRLGRPQTREHLAALLWPESSQERASGNLRMALAALREHVPDAVEITRTDIRVMGILDAAVLESELDALKAELSGARKLSAESLLRLDSALRVYNGDFMAQFSLPDSPVFDAWALGEREALRRRYVGAVGVLIDAYRAQKRYREGVDWALRLLTADPLNEETHRRLMHLYVASGDRTSALAQFESCQTLLWDELGVEPEDDTIALYEDIASGKIEAAPVHVSVTQTIAVIPPTNLPAQLTPFMGREAEVDEVVKRVIAARLVTLLGMGGLGKTRLALRACEFLLTKGLFPNGVFFIDLAPLHDPALIVNAVATALEITTAPLAESTTAYLRDKRLLLVLDNFEHLLDGVDIVENWLRVAPNVRILATSREPLRLYGENLFDVPVLPPQEAAALFTARLTAVNADAVHAAPERIAALCERLECWPLALELAAGLARNRTVDEIYSAIDSRLGVLQTTMRGVPERQRTLFNTIDYSFHLLPPEEQTMFRRLSVFSGGWVPAAAQAVTGQPADLLDALADKGLIRRGRLENGDRWFSMLETLREFGASLLETLDETHSMSAAHLSYYADFADGLVSELRVSGSAPLQFRVIAEMDNFRAALQFAVQDPRHAMAEGRIVAGIGFFMFRRGQNAELLKHAEYALRHRGVFPPMMLADVLSMVGHAAHAHDNVARADEAHHEALEIYREIGDRWGEAEMLRCIVTRSIDTDLRLKRERQALDIAIELDDKFLIAAIAGNHGSTLHDMGLVDEALAVLRKGVEASTGGLEHMAPHVYVNIAGILYSINEIDESIRHYEQILPISRVYAPVISPIVSIELADAYVTVGRYEEALALYREVSARPDHLSPNSRRRLDMTGALIAYHVGDWTGVQALYASALGEMEFDDVPFFILMELMIGVARIIAWQVNAGLWSDAYALYIALEAMAGLMQFSLLRITATVRLTSAEIAAKLSDAERAEAEARAAQVDPRRVFGYALQLLPALAPA